MLIYHWLSFLLYLLIFMFFKKTVFRKCCLCTPVGSFWPTWLGAPHPFPLTLHYCWTKFSGFPYSQFAVTCNRPILPAFLLCQLHPAVCFLQLVLCRPSQTASFMELMKGQVDRMLAKEKSAQDKSGFENSFRSSHCGSAERKLASIHEEAGLIPGLTQWDKDLALPWAVV